VLYNTINQTFILKLVSIFQFYGIRVIYHVHGYGCLGRIHLRVLREQRSKALLYWCGKAPI